jgi:2-polyprenyl-3-methyl-5-hydroxy-6-metoxy-1,4-benzoquinol methylase
MEVSGGLKENGVFVGNAYDKYDSRNPIVRKIMQGFTNSLSVLVNNAAPKTIHEVGCGEGYWVIKWNKEGFLASGSDFSPKVIELARKNAESRGFSPEIFSVRDIYDIRANDERADLIVCIEVLEHLEHPEIAMAHLKQITERYIILSVPREPVWRILNILRGKYIKHLGNTPGHIQHWTHHSFLRMVRQYFNINAVLTPLPWTIVLCQPLKICNHQ